jgi:hypothetical protein
VSGAHRDDLGARLEAARPSSHTRAVWLWQPSGLWLSLHCARAGSGEPPRAAVRALRRQGACVALYPGRVWRSAAFLDILGPRNHLQLVEQGVA